nr:transcription factor MYB1R1-like [Ipomoea batatas]
MATRCCTQYGSNGHNSRSCGESSSVSAASGGSGEIMLFGVRVKVDPMRKSVSLNNLSQYEQPNDDNKNSGNNDSTKAAAADEGYASADDAVPNQSSSGRERKRGVPWTEEEHKLFLLGLQKVGKGDWRGISRNFVKTRTPTQVASHAQKYFLRRSNLNRRRRRSSLFDITTESVSPYSMDEGKASQESQVPPIVSPTSLSISESSQMNAFQGPPIPVTACPVFVLLQNEKPIENLMLGRGDQVNNASSMFVQPLSILSVPNASTMIDLNMNQNSTMDPSSLSLRLSLSGDQSQPTHPAFLGMSGFSNGDSVISVA